MAAEGPSLITVGERPRRMLVALSFRGYRQLRRVLPRRWLARFLLSASWVTERLAWIQLFHWLGPDEAIQRLRPHTVPFIRDHTPRGGRALDLGGGRGLATREMARSAREVVYVDYDAANVEAAKATISAPNVIFVLGDGLEAAVEHGPFDVVFALHLLEHLPEPVEALRALSARCSRIAIEVPDFGSNPLNEARRREGLPYWWDDDHKSEFTAESLREVIELAGCVVEQLWETNGMLLAIAQSPITL